MKMRKQVFLGISALALLLAAGTPADAYVKCIWADDINSSHETVVGETTQIKCVCDDPAAATYEVTGPQTDGGLVANSYAIESNLLTINSSGTYTMTVKDANGISLGSDTYAITAAADSVPTRKRIAIENGLWYLHKAMTRYATVPNGAPGGYLAESGEWGSPFGGGFWSAQAFVDAKMLVTGNPDNPYVEDVQRLVNWTTEHLVIMSFTGNLDSGRNPEDRTNTAMKDGLGVFFVAHDGSPEIEYGFGPALKFLATCGFNAASTVTPAAWNDDLNCGTGASISTWKFPQIWQQMIDYLAWSQLNTVGNAYYGNGWCPTKTTSSLALGSKGGWPYFSEGWQADPSDAYNTFGGGAGNYGDVAVTYWTVQGIASAVTALGATGSGSGVYYPTVVRTDLSAFATSHQNLLSGEFTFGPASHYHLLERAGQGLVLMQWAGVSSSSSKVTAAKNFIKSNWTKNTFHSHQSWPAQSSICHDEWGNEQQCYQHFQMDANPLGFWLNGQFETVATLDDINLFAFKAVTEGLTAYNVTDIPAASPDDYKTYYLGLLINNQLPSGAWDDHAWISGYLPAGTGWAISTLMKL